MIREMLSPVPDCNNLTALVLTHATNMKLRTPKKETFISRLSTTSRSCCCYPCYLIILRVISSYRHNSSEMISIGLSLLTVAVETSGATLAKYQSLLKLCQNEVARALFRLVQVLSYYHCVHGNY